MKKITIISLTTLQVISILMSAVIVVGYASIRSQALDFTNEFDQELALLNSTSFRFEVNFKDDIPILVEVPLSEIIDVDELLPDTVRINSTIPIKQSVAISQNIPATVDIPVIGQTQIIIPVKATIPIDTTVKVDQDVNVQLNVTGDPIIRVSRDIPVDISFPIEKSLADLGLDTHIIQAHSILNSLRLFFLSPAQDLPVVNTPTVEIIEISN